MSVHLEAELAALKEKLLLMAARAEDAVSNAVKAVLQRDADLGRRVKEEDRVLDKFEIEIDDTAIHLLAKAPLASDLRLITIAMKISHDLERVGDEATTIARQAVELVKETPPTERPEIQRMAQISLEMLRAALDAFVSRAPDKARLVIPRDAEVDALNKQLHRESVAFMVEHPESITTCLHVMRVSKSLERIADHATNIAEEVVYLYEGRDIRHVGKSAFAPPKS